METAAGAASFTAATMGSLDASYGAAATALSDPSLRIDVLASRTQAPIATPARTSQPKRMTFDFI